MNSPFFTSSTVRARRELELLRLETARMHRIAMFSQVLIVASCLAALFFICLIHWPEQTKAAVETLRSYLP